MTPCPFCGRSELVFWKGSMGREPLCVVACLNCGTSGPTKVSEQQAIEAWNQRSPEMHRSAPRERAAEKINLEKLSVQNEMILLELRRKSYPQYERQTLTTPLRFDGLYKSEKYLDAGDGRLYWNYLRFFRSGAVLGICMTGETQECMRWLQMRNESGDLSRGRYQLIGSTIRFSTINSYGTVNYRGLIRNKALELEYHSQTNGNCGIIDFHFGAPSPGS
jgi:Lar family restriction alleviation protein